MGNRVKWIKNTKGEDKSIPLAKHWLHHPQRQQYDGVVFRPEKQVDGYFNLWTGFAVEPREGCCEKFLAHIRDNVCCGCDQHYDWVIAFFADIVQHPCEKEVGVSLAPSAAHRAWVSTQGQ